MRNTNKKKTEPKQKKPAAVAKSPDKLASKFKKVLKEMKPDEKTKKRTFKRQMTSTQPLEGLDQFIKSRKNPLTKMNCK